MAQTAWLAGGRNFCRPGGPEGAALRRMCLDPDADVHVPRALEVSSCVASGSPGLTDPDPRHGRRSRGPAASPQEQRAAHALTPPAGPQGASARRFHAGREALPEAPARWPSRVLPAREPEPASVRAAPRAQRRKADQQAGQRPAVPANRRRLWKSERMQPGLEGTVAPGQRPSGVAVWPAFLHVPPPLGLHLPAASSWPRHPGPTPAVEPT